MNHATSDELSMGSKTPASAGLIFLVRREVER